MTTQKERQDAVKRYQSMVIGSARVVTKSRPQGEGEVLSITCLYDFIKAYIKANPNLLYFTPKQKITREEKALLLLLQCFDENNKDIREIKHELTLTLTSIQRNRTKGGKK